MNKTFGLLFLMTLAACGQANDSSSDLNRTAIKSSSAVFVKEGTFKLYEEARFQPNSSCDIHTSLTLKNTNDGIVASVQNSLDGLCEIAINPDVRTYKLTATNTSCGSTTYKGILIDSETESVPTSIEVIDHRGRFCRDIVPAKIMLNESIASKEHRTLFSYDMGIIAQKSTSFTGTLVRVYAIGGESTGYAMQLEDGTIVELAIESADLLAAFADGSAAVVTGSYKTIPGVEIAERQVLVVKSMTVL